METKMEKDLKNEIEIANKCLKSEGIKAEFYLSCSKYICIDFKINNEMLKMCIEKAHKATKKNFKSIDVDIYINEKTIRFSETVYSKKQIEKLLFCLTKSENNSVYSSCIQTALNALNISYELSYEYNQLSDYINSQDFYENVYQNRQIN